MPIIPAYIANRQLGFDTGTPTGNASVRTTPQPLTSPGPYQAGAFAIAQAGAAVRQIGQEVQQLAFANQRVHDAQASEKASQTFQQQHDADIQALHNQALVPDEDTGTLSLLDPKARGDRALQMGQDTIARLGEPLTPRQRGLFQVQAQQYLSVSTRQVRERAQAEFLKDAQETITSSVETYTQQAINATDRVQAGLAMTNMTRVLDDGVKTGTITPATKTQLLRKATDDVQVNAVQVATGADPQAMRTQLLLQSRGEPTRDDLPLAPLAHLPALLANATTVYRGQLQEVQNTAQQVEHRTRKLQEQVAKGHEARISEILPSPDTVPLYDQALKDVNRDALDGKLDRAEQTQLVNTLRTLRAVAVNPPQQDDRATETRLTVRLNAADNPKDHADFRQQVIQDAPKLKVDTMKAFLAQSRERERGDHFSQLPGVRAGRQTILGGDVTEATMVSMLRGGMQEAEQIRVRTALDVYNTQVEEWAKTSTVRANADAPALALKIRREFVDQPAQEAKITGLPPSLQKVTEPSQAAEVIRRLPGLTSAEKGRMWQRWQDAHPQTPRTPPPPPSATSPPASGTRQRNPVAPQPVTPGGTP